jgi:hypothetical protein
MENIKIEWKHTGYIFKGYQIFYKDKVIFSSEDDICASIGSVVTINDKEYKVTGFGRGAFIEGDISYSRIFVE